MNDMTKNYEKKNIILMPHEHKNYMDKLTNVKSKFKLASNI